MKPSLQFSVLLSMLLSTACMAAEPSVCKSICAEQKRECRASAQHKTKLDHSLVAGHTETRHRDARALGKLQGTSQDAKAAEQSDFQKRRREREHSCDSKATTCSRACGSVAPDSIVKPKTQQ